MANSENEFVSIFKMCHLEQYVNKVLDYTQRYNNSHSSYYAPSNLIGKPECYPSYGDVPETYSFRTYGKWWKQRECVQESYRLQDDDPLGVEDYIIVEFETLVIPKEICIYETHNPGAVVRIWAKTMKFEKIFWVLLWEGLPEICRGYARTFRPLIRKVNFFTKVIKIEVNQSRLSYHTSIDAIILAGFQTNSILQQQMIQKGMIYLNNTHVQLDVENSDDNIIKEQGVDLFFKLPYEIVVHIFQYLDLKSLARCSRINKRWNQIAADPFLYQNLNLKPYWYLVNCDTLKYFMKKCETLKKIDLSWCGIEEPNDFTLHLSNMLKANVKSLTHVSLGNCQCIDGDLIKDLSYCGELVDLRLNNLKSNIFLKFRNLESLTKLVSLDLTSTDITDDELIPVLKSNPNLKHLIIDLCENLSRLDDVVEIVSEFNTNLKTWSSWKTLSLTANGVRFFGNCPNIIDLDLGWCLVNKDPGHCLKFVSEGCPNLKRLILSEWRGLNDFLLKCIITECRELTQVDFLGILNITSDLCVKALMGLPKLRLLDISYCDNITAEEVMLWRQTYPHVTIQSTLA